MDAVLARGSHGSVHGGAEYTKRDRTEDEVRAYLYWATAPDWAFSAEFEWDEFENENELVDVARLRTMTVPLQVGYFAENGLFAKAGVNFVSQEVEERLEPFFDQTRENFVTVDLGVGYPLPERRGSVSLEVRNLFDEEFLYQDLDSISNTTTRPRFLPARTILGRLSLSF
jgi:outer membrane receptor protein involved in Fe transport